MTARAARSAGVRAGPWLSRGVAGCDKEIPGRSGERTGRLGMPKLRPGEDAWDRIGTAAPAIPADAAAPAEEGTRMAAESARAKPCAPQTPGKPATKEADIMMAGSRRISSRRVQYARERRMGSTGPIFCFYGPISRWALVRP